MQLPWSGAGRGRVLRRLAISRAALRRLPGGAPTADDHVVDLVVAARLLGMRVLTLEARVVVDRAAAGDLRGLAVATDRSRGLELVDASDASRRSDRSGSAK